MKTSKNPAPVSIVRKGVAWLYTGPCSKAGAGVLIMGKRIEYQKGEKVGECIYLKETDQIIFPSGKKERRAIFRCNCGNKFEATISQIKGYHTMSCGCVQRAKSSEAHKTHGLSQHTLFARWGAMKNRCYNPKSERCKDYGGRGITVCDQWRHDFQSYFDYVMELPNALAPGLTIDRIRNNEGYKPGNLRWATAKQQANNRRNNIKKHEIQ